MIDVDVMQDASEIVHYDNPEIPLYIRTGILSEYPDMKALCHWHEDIELIYIIDGEMLYNTNGNIVLLKEGDCIIINSRQMHYGYSRQYHECHFICILFHPSLLLANRRIYRDYVAPIIENRGIEYIYYHSQSPDHSFVSDLILQMHALREESKDAYELECISCICLLWSFLYRRCQSLLQQIPNSDNSDLTLQKKMVSYIHAHYQDTISLDEIAASGNMSRSKCCSVFKRYLQQSPIDFLNKYRLEVSCYLLSHTDSSVSQIAMSCGFNHLSYFSKLFVREYECTPTEYRKLHFSAS